MVLRAPLYTFAFLCSLLTANAGHSAPGSDPVIINESRSVKHLHNFLLDAWYETGWLGLASLLGLLAYLFTQVLSRLREANRTEFQLAVPLISAVMAIMTAAFLDPSYRSKEFSMFMFVYLAALWQLAEYRRRREQNG